MIERLRVFKNAPGWLDVAAALTLFNRTMATARTASRRFVAGGIHQPPPWAATIQVWLNGPPHR